MFTLIENRKGGRTRALVAPLAWLIVTIIGIVLRPDGSGHGTHRQLGLPPCPSVIFWGRPCPACGLTTSWTHLLHGHVLASFVSNAIGPFLYIAFTLYALGHLVAFIKHKEWDTDTKAFNWSVSTLLLIFLAYGGIRFSQTRYEGPAVADAWFSAHPK